MVVVKIDDENLLFTTYPPMGNPDTRRKVVADYTLDTTNEIVMWASQQAWGDFVGVGHGLAVFADHRDALFFKLRWCDVIFRS